MAARKLQVEIDRTLKKVAEGVDLFDAIHDKMQASTNQAQKEKQMMDLKTQIKKLQRMRDQIKTWIARADVKDKSQLVDHRRLIETQMERYKACEKEMVKAFSKEGLIQAKVDPREQEKEEAASWLQAQVGELQMQVESAEAEIEALRGTGKKRVKGGSAAAGRLEELESLNGRRKWHINRLEIVLRLLDNDSMSPEKIFRLKEDVQYFVESNTDTDFDEDEGIYDDLNLDEEFSLAPDDHDNAESDTASKDLPPRTPSGKHDEESQWNDKARDVGGRSRPSSIHTLNYDPFVSPVASSRTDEPQAASAKYEGPYGPVGEVQRDEHDDNIIPIPVDAGHPKPIQEAPPARRIEGFDTGESPPPPSRSGSPENVVDLHPPVHHDHVTISPSPASEGIPMDCGVVPSFFTYPSGQETSRRRKASPQRPEQGEVGGENSRTRVGWASPFAVDHRTNNPHQQDSGKPTDGVYNVRHELDAHGVSFHVSPSSSSSGYDSHLHLPASPHRFITSSVKPPPPQDSRPLHACGWAEYLLPDESLYYVHQAYQVVTDTDLSDEKRLDAVMAYLEDHGDVIPPGQELWLRDTGSNESRFHPLRCLVDHTKQSVTFESSYEANGGGERHSTHRSHRDDRLDTKCQYWSFMETYPAHTSLPPDSCREAMDALHWASTNAFLPSHHSESAFTQEECQGLTSLLQSIEKRGETLLRTHTVSKILLRVIYWRQSQSRSDKPSSADAGRGGLRRECHSMLVRSGPFMLTAGVYACLATAIALGPSKTFVQMAGIGALLFSLSPVVSIVMSVAQPKANGDPMVPRERRDMLMFSRKDHIITPPARPP